MHESPVKRDISEELALGHDSFASHPGRVDLSAERLEQFQPETALAQWVWRIWPAFRFLGIGFSFSDKLAEQLRFGDSRAAVVVSRSPLLVAAYTADIDCVAILKFPDEFVYKYRLSVGSRLLTVNTYGEDEPHPDLIRGELADGPWTQLIPQIADFLTEDRRRLEIRKREIAESEWSRVFDLGSQYIASFPGIYRNGNPYHTYEVHPEAERIVRIGVRGL